jgi:hypothetical protein
VRARLAILENRRQLPSEEKEKKPTLRRTPQKAEDSNAEDEWPTLKRRDN